MVQIDTRGIWMKFMYKKIHGSEMRNDRND